VQWGAVPLTPPHSSVLPSRAHPALLESGCISALGRSSPQASEISEASGLTEPHYIQEERPFCVQPGYSQQNLGYIGKI